MTRVRLSCCALVIAAPAFGQGTLVWDESLNGPLGNSPATATHLGTLAIGTNSLMGATEIEPTGGNFLIHEDYMLFTLAGGSTLSALSLSVDQQGVLVWLGSSDFNQEYASVRSAASGDLLPQFEIASPPPGTYSMYLANLNSGGTPLTANYRLDFIVTPVPEPGTLALLALGSAALAWRGLRQEEK